MAFNFSKLRGRITEVYGSGKAFAEAMEMSERTLSLKLNGKVDWTQSEMYKASDALHFDHNQIPDYFFRLEVQY